MNRRRHPVAKQEFQHLAFEQRVRAPHLQTRAGDGRDRLSHKIFSFEVARSDGRSLALTIQAPGAVAHYKARRVNLRGSLGDTPADIGMVSEGLLITSWLSLMECLFGRFQSAD